LRLEAQVHQFRCLISLSVIATLLLGAATARCAIVTVGHPMADPVLSTSPSGIKATLLNLTIAEPNARAASPVDGLIVRWNLRGAQGGPLRLRVLRPSGPDAYTAVGTSGAVTGTAADLETFPTSLPVKAGDTIGLDVVEGVEVGVTPNPASVIGAIDFKAPGAEFAFNAEIQPAPQISSTSPAVSPVGGGLPVVVSGTDFTSVTAVAFGALPAQSFTVDSEAQITAVPPPAAAPGPVTLTVTTPAGAATAPFSYKRLCVVPKLKKLELKAAKRKLRKAKCKLGAVKTRKGATPKSGKVVRQIPKAGQVRKSGKEVRVTLG
jgi:hypothetical protein